ncbi:hypothetical protein [Maribacter sp. 2-571]|uniref:hypothetical protein n=1 Tax=Maribacter sp. 2-571 TaxID=3417569 RepID=UPI003D33B86C
MSLKKKTVSELSSAAQQKILGGSYPTACGCNGGGTASLSCGSRIGNAGCCY